MFKKNVNGTAVTNCGKYDCRHNNDGYCTTSTIAVDKDGKCILASKAPAKMQPGTYSSTYFKEPSNADSKKPETNTSKLPGPHIG